MSEVRVKEGESLDSALKRFKRSCAKANEKVAKFLDGMEIIKIIHVPNKLVNLIAKPKT